MPNSSPESTRMELLKNYQSVEPKEEEEEEEAAAGAAENQNNSHARTHTIDFVLVNKLTTTATTTTTTTAATALSVEEKEQEERFSTWRRNFEEELRLEGLELEESYVDNLPLRFVKVFAPFEVCTRYAEILKLRMPMKEKMDCRLSTDRVILLHFPGLPPLEFTPPAVFQDMSDCVSRLFTFVRPDPQVFPPKNRHFTAVYDRTKDYLFQVTTDFFQPSVRARIIDFILRRKRFAPPPPGETAAGGGGGCGETGTGDTLNFGIEKLLAEGAYVAAYPVHDGDLHVGVGGGGNQRAHLYAHWASLRQLHKYQPLDYVKDYFGVKIALYFAWLGFYTYMLIPASAVGLLCFIYALATINAHAPSNDICAAGGGGGGSSSVANTTTMCPLCDKFCDFWDLRETCLHAKFTYLVDNPATIFFTAFMSLWAALFLEMWKRYSAEITHRWDLTGFDIQEEHPRPQYLARLAHINKRSVNIVTKTVEPKPPFWRMRFPGVVLSLSTVFLLVTMALVAVVGVILYRMSVLASLSIHSLHEENVLTSHALIFTSATAACINLVCIMIFNQVYARLAERLTELELQRTQTEFDDSLTLKIYLLQFVNYYASIFYIAFFKGKLIGYPGDYFRIFGYRQEECSPGGCLLELSVQLAIIMVGKQAMNTLMEMVLPHLYKWYNMFTVGEGVKDAYTTWPRFAKDFQLVNFDPRGLFPEYLEMVLQYGFVTVFVASFPLAPLFAFLNNVFEMRLDARKLLTHFRRPVPQRVKDIGVWFKILDSIGKLAVITNAFIIAFTSNFIPELVYRHVVSGSDSLEGFLDYSLSTFRVADYPSQYRPTTTPDSPEYCRYPDFRLPPGGPDQYKYAPIYWHILAARLAFVVVFENVVCAIIMFIKWLIPDMSLRLQEQIRREAYVTNELIIEQELRRARQGQTGAATPQPPHRRRRQHNHQPPRPRGASWGGPEHV